MTKATVVTATGLAKHLDLSRQRVMQLVDEGVIARLADGRFDQDVCRIRYIRFVREEGRRANTSEETRRLIDAKARSVEIANLKREGELAPVAEAIEFVNECLGGFKSDMDGFAASVTRDVTLRQRIDARVNEIFRASSERFAREAAKLRAAAKS